VRIMPPDSADYTVVSIYKIKQLVRIIARLYHRHFSTSHIAIMHEKSLFRANIRT
jgi:hypothetical protein